MCFSCGCLSNTSSCSLYVIGGMPVFIFVSPVVPSLIQLSLLSKHFDDSSEVLYVVLLHHCCLDLINNVLQHESPCSIMWKCSALNHVCDHHKLFFSLSIKFYLFLFAILVIVGFMIQPVWSIVTPARSGFVMAVEIHPAGKIYWLTSLPCGVII